jgi:hypothetical protein
MLRDYIVKQFVKNAGTLTLVNIDDQVWTWTKRNALREELAGQKFSKLRQWALQVGIPEQTLELIVDEDVPRESIVELLVDKLVEEDIEPAALLKLRTDTVSTGIPQHMDDGNDGPRQQTKKVRLEVGGLKVDEEEATATNEEKVALQKVAEDTNAEVVAMRKEAEAVRSAAEEAKTPRKAAATKTGAPLIVVQPVLSGNLKNTTGLTDSAPTGLTPVAAVANAFAAVDVRIRLPPKVCRPQLRHFRQVLRVLPVPRATAPVSLSLGRALRHRKPGAVAKSSAGRRWVRRFS